MAAEAEEVIVEEEEAAQVVEEELGCDRSEFVAIVPEGRTRPKRRSSLHFWAIRARTAAADLLNRRRILAAKGRIVC